MNFESPEVLSDLYRDLRERHLLPVIIVLLAAMVFVMVVLSKPPEHHAAVPATSQAIKPSSSSVPASQVVLSQPGLRNYKKRLKGDSPTDPFTSLPGTGPSGSGSSGGATVPGANSPLTNGVTPSNAAALTPEGQDAKAAENGGSTGVPSGTTTGSSGSAPSGGSSGSGQSSVKYYSYRVKLRAGQLGKGDLKVYDSVGTLANLPSKQTPALAYLGVTKDTSFNAKTAVFLVSSAVSSVSGEGDCTFAGSACQLLSLKPGQHEDVVWSDGLTYRIELVKFLLVSRNKLPSIGNPSSGSNGSSGTGRSARKHSKHAKHAKQTSFYFSF